MADGEKCAKQRTLQTALMLLRARVANWSNLEDMERP